MPSERGRDDYVMYAITKADAGEGGP
jgi:hypothetical protein